MSLSTGFSTLHLPGIPTDPQQFLDIVLDETQLVTCTNIVTLQAKIVTNYPGHTYFWEQIGGTPVTWLEPQNQLMVTFQKPGTLGDLTFRFWADRYTSKQQYKDIVVTGVARDDLPQSLVARNSGGSSALLAGVSNSQLLPGISPYGTATVNNTKKLLLWTNPSNGLYYNYTKTEVYQNIGGVPTLLATKMVPTEQYFDTGASQPQVGSVYTLKIYYDVYGVGQIIRSVDSEAPGALIDPTIVTIDASDTTNCALVGENPAAITVSATQIVSLITLPGVIDDNLNSAQLISYNTGQLQTFQTQIVSLITLPDTIDDTVTSTQLNTFNSGNLIKFQVQVSDGITVIG